MSLKVEDKSIVTPGELLAEGTKFRAGEGTYQEGKAIFSKVIGMVKISGNYINVVPLSGTYIPKVGDLVVGKIIDLTPLGWRVDINSPYSAVLSAKDLVSQGFKKGDDLNKFLNIGEYVAAVVSKVNLSSNMVDLTVNWRDTNVRLGKLKEGLVMTINSSRVPRVIGSKASMFKLLKEKTNCNIVVGQNGVIWANGEAKSLAILFKAIKEIEENAHLPGLTDRISKFLESNLK